MLVVAIETDAAGAASLAEAASTLPVTEFDTREVEAQVGDPDTWMFVAQMAPTVVTALSATVIGLVKQRKIKYLKIGDVEIRDATPDQVARVLSAVDSRGQ
jgi:hypothetical protein